MEKKVNTRGLVIGLLIVAVIIVAAFVWVYFGATGRIPDIGLGLQVNRWWMLGGLLVAAVILYALYPKGGRAK